MRCLFKLMPKPLRCLVFVVVLTGFLVSSVNLCAVSEAGVIFLLIEPSSRAGGMAHAHVAQVDDAFAGYWNPGAMAFNRKVQFAGMHTNWFGDVPGIDDIYLEYLGWNQFFEDIGNLGLHVIYLTYGSQDRTDEFGNFLGTFTSYELAVAASYAYQATENLGLGVTFKYILSDLAPAGTGETEQGIKGRGISYAFDFGVKYRDFIPAILPRLDFGLNLQNVGPNITYINEAQSDPLPMNWRMGLSYRALERENERFTVNADMNKLLANRDPFYKRIFTAWNDDSFKRELEQTIFNIGGEFVYLNLLALRAGYIYDKAGSIKGPSFGAGVQYTFVQRYKVNFDFAMQQGGELTDYNKTFSLNLEF